MREEPDYTKLRFVIVQSLRLRSYFLVKHWAFSPDIEAGGRTGPFELINLIIYKPEIVEYIFPVSPVLMM